MRLLRRFRDSVCYRACEVLRRSKAEHLARELGVREGTFADADVLRVVASIKASLLKRVDLLVDVGAHKGAFALPAMQALLARKTICFEPNVVLHPVLHATLSGLDAEVRGCALGASPGLMPFHVHRDPAMSSLLDTDPGTLAREFAFYDGSATEDVVVPVSTLDLELAGGLLKESDNCFLKIDTQGSELEVLRGATGTLERCEGVLIEHMFTTPYVGQVGFADVVLFMRSLQFRCAGALHIYRRPSWRISGVDFLFVRDL